MVNYENSAVQIYKCVDGAYKLDFNAIKSIFEKVQDTLIAIYCISGKFRSGKSFIMGLFLKYLVNSQRGDWMNKPIPSSFKYSNSVKRVTSGIWIWSEPIIKKNSEGQDVAIFLMDTQGWFDDRTSMKDNALIFGLATLFSSVMIFNVDKRIGEDDLQYLQNFSFTAKLLDERNNDQPFQQLTFLIRDWISTSEEEGFEYGYYDQQKSINGKNFTTDQIYPRLDQIIDAQKIREIICSTYENISSYLMPFPGQVVEMADFNSKNSSREFIEHLKSFAGILFDSNNILPKKFAGNYLTGNTFISYAENWAKDFEIDSTPVGLFNPIAVSEEPYLLAYQTSIDYYDESMNRRINQSKNIIDLKNAIDEQRIILEESKAIFLVNQKLKKEQIRNRYLKNLIGELEIRENHYKKLIENKIKLKMAEYTQMNDRESISNDELKVFDEEQLNNPLRNNIDEIKDEIEKEQLDFIHMRIVNRKNWLMRFIGKIVGYFK